MTAPIVLALRLLAVAALYGFLGFALWMMWQELRLGSASGARSRVPPIRLEVKTRNEKPLVRQFAQPEVTVGRDPLSDVALGDKAISARHARLSFHDGQWWVDDLDSTNGTRLNRQRLEGSTVLMSGDEIKCGSVRLLVTLPAEGLVSGTRTGGQDG
jgi:pSer/pThr/pTyr-binding forkhead associated (FHA) protein